MSNALDADEQQQIRTLGRLGWTLSRIQAATGIPRETISRHLKVAGISVRRRGRSSEATAKTAINEGVQQLYALVWAEPVQKIGPRSVRPSVREGYVGSSRWPLNTGRYRGRRLAARGT